MSKRHRKETREIWALQDRISALEVRLSDFMKLFERRAGPDDPAPAWAPGYDPDKAKPLGSFFRLPDHKDPQ